MLHSFFFDTVASRPEDPAIWVDGRVSSYGQLNACATRISTGLRIVAAGQPTRRCVLFAYRSLAAYAGVLGILDAGLAYVPLNPKFPAARNAAAIERSASPILLVDRGCAAKLGEILALVESPPQVFVIDDTDDTDNIDNIDDTAVMNDDAPPPWPHLPRPDGVHVATNQGALEDLAYILFTSGTTGTPKGVMVSHANARAYIGGLSRLSAPAPGDRHIQICDLTFDPSVHDMFNCWRDGACLYVPDNIDALDLFAFAREHRITHWNSVPAIAGFLQQFRKLAPGAFPDLRVSFFGGEALPCALAKAWRRAAPSCRLFNIYGPTETTVACTRFEVTEAFLQSSDYPVVPLGWANPDLEMVVVDSHLEPVEPGREGELVVGGPQVTVGYLTLNEADHRRYFVKAYPGHRARRWYRTGDVVHQSVDCGLIFHGRGDSQVKIRGHRIDLQEVEHVVREASGAAMCAVIPWPIDTAGRPVGMVAFVLEPRLDAAQTLRACRTWLPASSLPNRIIELDELPLNSNGKVDRHVLSGMCDGSVPLPQRQPTPT